MQTYLGLANLLRRHLSGEDLTPVCQAMIQKATQDPSDAASLMDAATIFQFRGDAELGLQLQQEALKTCRVYCIPAAQPVRLRVLALMAPGRIMANVPIECLVEDSDIELSVLFASATEVHPSDIPQHDVLFVAIGESEANEPILDAWRPLLADWPRPVLNAPRDLEHLTRDVAARTLSALPGVDMPETQRLDRAQLEACAQSPDGLRLPLILRPIDSHAGEDLRKIDSPEDLSQALAAIDSDAFFVSPFIDYRSPDGLYRKYRLVLIGGRPFASHMAVSSDWMIHYLNAGMAESAEKRAEEAAFMASFEEDFAVRHGEALAAIHAAIGLDYLGIDCAESSDGRLLIFEVDPAMVVHALDPVDLYPYKQPAMRKVFDAFRALLLEAAETKCRGPVPRPE